MEAAPGLSVPVYDSICEFSFMNEKKNNFISNGPFENDNIIT